MRGTLSILGAGDHARVVGDILESRGEESRIACFVDLVAKSEMISVWKSFPVFSSIEKFLADFGKSPGEFVVAFGSIKVRARLFQQMTDLQFRPVALMHARSMVAASATVGGGTTICAGAVIGVDARIGQNVIINTAASIDHDCQIGDHVNVSPGVTLAGRVTIGERTMLGAGATVIDEVRIGSDCLIAAGAVVVSDVPSGTTVMGVPAKPKSNL